MTPTFVGGKLMATSHRIYNDIMGLSNFVRQVSVAQGKNLLIDAIREYFKDDVLYRYETDGFGFHLRQILQTFLQISKKNEQQEYISEIFSDTKTDFIQQYQ